MALSAAVVWEVRGGAGSDTNGGGWDGTVSSPGTDWSQRNSPEYALTNGVTNGTTTITTVSASADMVGNVVYIAGGTGSITAGRYTVTAASVGTSITVDRSTGLTTGTGVTINVGGALATLAPLFVSSTVSVAVPGNIVWVTGTITVTSPYFLISGFNGPSGARSLIHGYGSSRGDSGHATITTATNSQQIIALYGQPTGIEICQVDMSSTAGTPGSGLYVWYQNAGSIILRDCKLSGFQYGIDGDTNGSIGKLTLFEVEITGCTSHGIYQSGGESFLFGCYIHANTGDGIRLIGSTGASLHSYGSVLYANGGNGVYDDSSSTSRDVILVNSVLYGNTSNGVEVGLSSSWQSIVSVNSIYYGNGGYGMDFPSVSTGNSPLNVVIQYNNAFGSNTSGARNSGAPAGVSDVTLTGDPCTSASTGDFSLNSTAGAGAACTGAGWQSTVV